MPALHLLSSSRSSACLPLPSLPRLLSPSTSQAPCGTEKGQRPPRCPRRCAVAPTCGHGDQCKVRGRCDGAWCVWQCFREASMHLLFFMGVTLSFSCSCVFLRKDDINFCLLVLLAHTPAAVKESLRSVHALWSSHFTFHLLSLRSSLHLFPFFPSPLLAPSLSLWLLSPLSARVQQGTALRTLMPSQVPYDPHAPVTVCAASHHTVFRILATLCASMARLRYMSVFVNAGSTHSCACCHFIPLVHSSEL